MRTSTFIAGALAALALASGCGHHTRVVYMPPPLSPPGFPATVAIAPLANEAANMDGPILLRDDLARLFMSRGYATQQPGDTDMRLRGIGVNLGGQIAHVKWVDLRDALGTDAVVTGNVVKYTSVVTGAVNHRAVEMEAAMTDLRTGQILWHDRRTVVVDDDSALRESRRGGGFGLLANVAIGAVAGAVAHDCKAESQQVVNLMNQTLMPPGPQGAPPPMVAPNAPGAGTAPPPWGGSASARQTPLLQNAVPDGASFTAQSAPPPKNAAQPAASPAPSPTNSNPR